jgi:Contractile injection system tape measure protein
MHLIQHHTLEVQCSSQEFGKELHQQLGDVLEKELYPKLELVFDRYAHLNHTWAIELLELNLNPILKANWKEELVAQSLAQIEDYFKNNPPYISKNSTHETVEINSLVTHVEKATELLFVFLKTGILNQNSISNSLEKLLEKIEIDSVFFNKLIDLFAENLSFLVRWIFSVPDFFQLAVLQFATHFSFKSSIVLSEIQAEKVKFQLKNQQLNTFFSIEKRQQLQWIEWLQWIQIISATHPSKKDIAITFVRFSKQLWSIETNEILFFIKGIEEITAQKKTTFVINAPFFQTLIEHAKESNNQENMGRLELVEEAKETVKTADFHFINNAGLVLFHPFLLSLFEQLELCVSEKWKTKKDQHKAVLLTQYLIFGQDVFFENELIFNKVLCGLPVDSLVNTKLKITKKEKEKCQSLLLAVIEHWKPMRTSSVEALRETFLQRNGKLDLHNPNAIELWVEEKGYDVLLSQLPWGIGTFRTPWMDEYLICNWS